MRRRHGFTLIELLVVIAIIAVLMGILMPALRKVREQARQRSCGTRVRQQVLAMHMYADDNNTKYPLPPGAGFWLWDIHIDTVNYMLDSGMTPDMFYCPSNDNQQKNFDLYWEFEDNEWDGSRFVNGTRIVAGYCYILELEQGNRPEIRQPQDEIGRKKWLTTTQDKDQARSELVIDATLGQQENSAKYGYNFGLVTLGGMWNMYQIHDRTSHLKNDYEPTGGNMGFGDGHVEWRSFSEMEERYGGNNTPVFFW